MYVAPFNNSFTLPLPPTVIRVLFPNLTVFEKHGSRSTNLSLLPHMWFEQPESRNHSKLLFLPPVLAINTLSSMFISAMSITFSFSSKPA
ncbi:hypothetical protein HanRHA438_Chr10g0467111 [Helianthus annuus]|nr:hypothetical protein HanRHA438_Chr10g0467111 [Helianthus annuus]